ncbi:MAG: recombination protein RecR [Anaerolineales bacterium]|nr:MAG: recombination protein RecR [Anaerolineales bacterium]
MRSAAPKPVERLVEAFARLPGIGPKTASRLTYFLLRAPEGESLELAEALQEMRTQTRFCSLCFNITSNDADPCLICSDTGRDSSKICLVEEPLDVLALERTGEYSGRYHVLHGALSPIEGIGPDDLRIAELIDRIQEGTIEELIIATNPTLEGEATAMYIKQSLEGNDVRITRLARGLPSGGDLEYADITTLSQALQGRSEI